MSNAPGADLSKKAELSSEDAKGIFYGSSRYGGFKTSVGRRHTCLGLGAAAVGEQHDVSVSHSSEYACFLIFSSSNLLRFGGR